MAALDGNRPGWWVRRGRPWRRAPALRPPGRAPRREALQRRAVPQRRSVRDDEFFGLYRRVAGDPEDDPRRARRRGSPRVGRGVDSAGLISEQGAARYRGWVQWGL